MTNNVTFYAVDVDGTEMEVMAVRDSSGNIRTAFNTVRFVTAQAEVIISKRVTT